MGHKNKCQNKPDLVLSIDTNQFARPAEIELLFLEQKTCKYDLKVAEVVVKKKCRKLEVKGSSLDSEVIIELYRGDNPPTVYTFTNDASFGLVENLKKGDRLIFLHGETGEEGRVTLNVTLTKRSKQ